MYRNVTRKRAQRTTWVPYRPYTRSGGENAEIDEELIYRANGLGVFETMTRFYWLLIELARSC